MSRSTIEATATITPATEVSATHQHLIPRRPVGMPPANEASSAVNMENQNHTVIDAHALSDEHTTRHGNSKNFRSKNMWRYVDDKKCRGIDAYGRETQGVYDDRCISTQDGKFVPLRVQCTDEVLAAGSATWARKPIQPASHLLVRTSEWVFSPWDNPRGRMLPATLFLIAARSFIVIPMMLALRKIMKTNSEKFKLPFFIEMRTGSAFGRYDTVPYRYYGRAKKSRNAKDDIFLDATAHPVVPRQNCEGSANGELAILPSEPSLENAEESRLERTLLPRRLCFLDSPDGEESYEQPPDFRSTDVGKWMKRTGNDCPGYLFVGYITSHFSTEEDVEKLHQLAREATRDAGLECYWIAQNCLPGDNDYVRKSLDIWRISDVMRGSTKLVVALRKPEPQESIHTLLREWASSIWTLPELLLSPKSNFEVYHYSQRDHEASVALEKHSLAKNRFAGAYSLSKADGYRVRRLIDHYLGSLKLSDIELMTVALQCFSSRSSGSAGEQYLPGDYSYAMMGLVSRRPHINPFDSAFLAFARLSLGNYNDRMFERFLCLLPVNNNQVWHNMEDAYGAQLWDIEPHVQVAGIGTFNDDEIDPFHDEHFETEFLLASCADEATEDTYETPEIGSANGGEVHGDDIDSGPDLAPPASHSELRENDVVILDGCFAAKIRWNRFRRPKHAHWPTLMRSVIRLVLWLNVAFFILGVASIAVHYDSLYKARRNACGWVISPYYGSIWICDDVPDSWSPLRITGTITLSYSLIIYFVAPIAFRHLYRGKIREIEPGLYGFEGYLPIEKIERLIFGVVRNRLTWSSLASSPLSARTFRSDGWVMPEDPCVNESTRKLVEKAYSAGPGDMRVFTLVDTYSMTATLFEARQPPEVLLVCGSEGGMQRALACSFEWTTSTFFKETVLRLETRVLSRMDRIRRVRLGIKRPRKPATPAEWQAQKSESTSFGFRSRDDRSEYSIPIPSLE